MPTVGVYVPLNLQRELAKRWQLLPDSQESFELVRGLTLEALETHAGISHPAADFQPDCVWANLHKAGYRCRHCGGNG